MREVPSDVEQAILVTGGAGFIGSNFILQWIELEGAHVINLDKLTYAGNLRKLERIASHPRYRFVHGDIADRELFGRLLQDHRSRAIVHFAAEATLTVRFGHVDFYPYERGC